jgi:hypothetical protein
MAVGNSEGPEGPPMSTCGAVNRCMAKLQDVVCWRAWVSENHVALVVRFGHGRWVQYFCPGVN